MRAPFWPIGGRISSFSSRNQISPLSGTSSRLRQRSKVLLPRAAGTQHRDDLMGIGREAHPAQHRMGAQCLVHILGAQRGVTAALTGRGACSGLVSIAVCILPPGLRCRGSLVSDGEAAGTRPIERPEWSASQPAYSGASIYKLRIILISAAYLPLTLARCCRWEPDFKLPDGRYRLCAFR